MNVCSQMEIDTCCISGQLLMLDDKTPHVACVVQAVNTSTADESHRPLVTAVTLSDESGRYEFIQLQPGHYQVRCYTLNGYVYYADSEILQVGQGTVLQGIDLRFPPFKKGIWRNYDTLSGVLHNRTWDIYHSPDGFLWFGTGIGISRYDGREFINFTTEDGLVDSAVRVLYGTPDGALWVGTIRGVSRYDGQEFTNLTGEDGLVNNNVWSICHDLAEVLWLGTREGISRYDGENFINYTRADGLPDDHVQAIHCDTDGVLWFGTSNGGVCRYDGQEWASLTKGDGLAHNCVRVIYGEPNGVLWFGTGHGVSRYDGQGFTSLTTEDGLVGESVWSICPAPGGVLWLGTPKGISRYDGESFINYTRADGLPDDHVQAIHCDTDGVLWFGTSNGGVCRYEECGLVSYMAQDGLVHNNVWSIHCDTDGVLWFGTSGGLSCYDGTGFTTQHGLVGEWVTSIQRDAGGLLWIGTNDNGVCCCDGKELTQFVAEDGLAGNCVLSVQADTYGTVWFGTKWDGVSHYDGREFVNFTTHNGIPGHWVLDIYCSPDGLVWLGTSAGVSRYDGRQFVNFTTEDGLANRYVNTIHADTDGTLWFGTNGGGVSCYDGKQFVNFTSKDGLAHNVVLAIYRDTAGVLWFGTDGGGVSAYDGQSWMSLDIRDGLAGNCVRAICQDLDGFLWFATDNGVTQYHRGPIGSTVGITAVTADRRYISPSALEPVIVGKRITFEYDSLDYKTHPEKRLYCYRLEGHDADWAHPTRLRAVDYEGLPIGEYTFHVRAIDRDLNYSEPATIQLTVQPDPRDIKVASLQTEVQHLRWEVGRKYQFENVIGRSAVIKQMFALMEKAIDSGLTVLISGETGTGKELVAKAIHYNSIRRQRPLQELNCGAVPRDLVASTLFGHRKGAFTGAAADQMGLFEAAMGGTVLLDEIGEMPSDAQVHLLRVLQERRVQRVGETQLRDVDVRVIAVTNRDLAAEVQAGRFREDLYYRLSVFPVHVPPLRERMDDIPLLAEHFLQQACSQLDRELQGLAPEAIEMLQGYAWPGNVRELENEMYRAAALTEEGFSIQVHHFSSQVTQGASLVQEVLSERLGYSQALDRFARRLVEETLRDSGNNRTLAAEKLGMHRPNLVRLIKRLGITNAMAGRRED